MRIEELSVSDMSAVLPQTWRPSFRHSAGKLGSHFIRAIREHRQILGWKTGRLGVTVPPIETGSPGEWVKVGPEATLVGYASPGEVGPDDIEQGKVFAVVKIDGADTVLCALVVCENPDILFPGMRLEARFGHASDTQPVLPSFQPIAATA